MAKDHVIYYKDGSVKGRGSMVDGIMDGYWVWFRNDGSKMRSGHFDMGKQIGEWITFDRKGEVFKVTNMDKK